MRKRLTERITHAKKGFLGYTLTEMLVVIGIIAIVCAIAIPSIFAIRDALRFAQANNYAKSIFLAAQQNLTEMRSDGGLGPVQSVNNPSTAVERGHCGFPDSEWSDQYVFTASRNTTLATGYALVLPANSVEATIRDEQVIIEYNPITGNVYSVFYCEDDTVQMLDLYKNKRLPREKSSRKELMVGYYDGSGLSGDHLEVEKSQAQVEFTNGEEGIVTVRIPMPSQYYSKPAAFEEGLKVTLTVRGESAWKGSMKLLIKDKGQADNCTPYNGNTMLVTYPLDSLADFMSFANLSAGADSASLTTLTDASFVAGENILPGDNVTIQADVTFDHEEGDPAVEIASGILAGINPMFDYLLPSPTESNKYILAVSNGRNLQNLNAIHPRIAESIKSVVFTDDIDWSDTVSYYNSTYPNTGVYSNSTGEAPARSLPYFIPIHNEYLFGTATFAYMNGGTAAGGFQGVLQWILEWLIDADFVRKDKVPTLTDELDTRVVNGKQIGDTHATIDGQGHKVLFLNVDSTAYTPCASTYYALGDTQIVDYYFSGLFGYANTTINALHVVNPKIKGHNFVSGIDMDPATGALLGAGGYNTLITNCSTYLDSSAEGFNWSYFGTNMQTDYSAAGSMSWYGVSGEGAVGGLVGYAKSHRTVIGELGSDTNYLAFSNCFAAVPVSGNVRGTTVKDYGYSNGIGGFIGNSQLTNFYNCYSSGAVRARNTYFQTADWQDNAVNLLGLGGNGRLSQGAGGFVGTSHGTRYTNCFTTSNVISSNNNATGGFVGMMCYDATKKYGHHDDNSMTKEQVAQHTVFDSCYAAGMCTNTKGKFLESFSGANGKIVVNYGTLKTFYTGDYYKLLAPYALTEKYATPPYSELYIFKDSYYLSQYQGTTNVTQESSSRCARPITYEDLMNLHGKFNTESWVNEQVEKIKEEKLLFSDIDYIVEATINALFPNAGDWWDFIGGIFTGQSNDTLKKIKEIWDTCSQYGDYRLYFLLDSYLDSKLVDLYYNAYNEAFPAPPWENATQLTTHYYGSASGKVYPFPKLQNMDYYGLWPEMTLDAGLAYYEVYQTNDGLLTRYYFDREDTSQLYNNADTVVVSDGYCIFTTNKSDKISIAVDGKIIESGLTPGSNASSVTMSSITSPDANSYYVVKLPQKVLSAATGNTYYHKIDITITGTDKTTGAEKTETVVAYFNPAVAVSQINSETRPTSIPGAISIRSARQLAELMREPVIWASNCHYVQHLNIDASAYTAAGYSASDASEILKMIAAGGSIGTEAIPFLGSYTGRGYAEQAQIIDFAPGINAAGTNGGGTAGLFGFIGQSGLVDCLEVRYTKPVSLSTADSVASIGLLAGISTGTIREVDVILEDTVALNASTASGLLAGTLSGSLTDCSVSMDGSVTLGAVNAGAVIGSANNAEIRNVTVAQNVTDNVPAPVLTATADYVGGFAGYLSDVNADNVSVSLNTMTASAEAAGGYAGYANGGSAGSVSVKIDSALSNTKTPAENAVAYAAGLTGVSDTVEYSDVSVLMNGQINGTSAAGMFGSIARGKLQGGQAMINGTISGSADAAGIAILAGEGDGVIESTIAYLPTSNSKILAGNRAAGFAVEMNSITSGTGVRLGQYGTSNAKLASGLIQGGTQAAGYACSITGSSNGTVMGHGTIDASSGTAAGFVVDLIESGRVAASGVTPAMGDRAVDYRGNSNANLIVNGSTAAGFAANVGAKASIENSYALGTVTASAAHATLTDPVEGTDAEGAVAPTHAGFVLNNEGIVNGCTANITISGGHAFCATNKGVVANCYGWYGDGIETNFADTIIVELYENDGYEGKYTSSYFVDLDRPEIDENTSGTSVVLFDTEGVIHNMLPSELSSSLGLLNETGTFDWYGPATYHARPYIAITPATYSYPMLRTHYGNWVTSPQYAYGVMYYEKHEITDASGNTTEQWMYNIVDLTDPEITVEDQLLSISNCDFTELTSTITDAGYAIFCKNTTDPNGLFAGGSDWIETNAIDDQTFNAQVVAEFAKKVKGNSTTRYSFFKIKDDAGKLLLDDTKGEIPVVTWYANAIGEAGTADKPYIIRTPEQFSYVGVGEMSSACFRQMHPLEVKDVTNIPTFSGSYDGNSQALIVVDISDWIDTLSGTVSNLNLTVGTSITLPAIDTVTATGVVNVSLPIAIEGNIDEASALIGTASGTVTTGKISLTGALNGSIIGTIDGTVTTGDIVIAGAVNGVLFNQVYASDSGAAVLTTGNISLRDVSGSACWLINTVTGSNVTLGNITTDTLFTTGDQTSGETEESGSSELDAQSSYSPVKKMIGTITGASTVTGGTTTPSVVNLFSAPLADNLIGTVSGGATVSNFDVLAGSLSTGLIGTVSGTEEAEGTSALTTALTNVHVSVGDSAAFNGSGLLVNALGACTSVTDCSVSTGAITLSAETDIPKYPVGEAQCRPFGGVTGAVPAGVTLNGNTVSTTLYVTGENGMLTIVGGITGINAGAINGGSADVVVNYTQMPFSGAEENPDDMVGIGGLVGWMRPGSSITGTDTAKVTASGALNLLPAEGVESASGTGRDNYFIGGAIAYDEAGTYTNVSSTVAVAREWADKVAVSNTNPNGTGSIGEFVGHVTNGSFVTCSADKASGSYQFLGTIAIDLKKTVDLVNNDSSVAVYGNPALFTDPQDMVDSDGQFDGYTTYVNDTHKDYANYLATLEDCIYTVVSTDGTTVYQQKFYPVEYFYGQSKQAQGYEYKAEIVTGGMEIIQNSSTLKYSDIATSLNPAAKTDYFVSIGDNYYRLYAYRDPGFFGIGAKYWIYYVVDGNNVYFADGSLINHNWAHCDLYKVSLGIESGKEYLITHNKMALAVSNGSATAIDIPSTDFFSFYDTDSINLARWQVSDSSWSNCVSSSIYLNLYRKGYGSNDNRLFASSSQNINTYAIYNGDVFNDGSELYATMRRAGDNSGYLAFTGSNFAVGTQSDATEITLYLVTEKGYIYRATFTVLKETSISYACDYFCDAKVIAPVATNNEI